MHAQTTESFSKAATSASLSSDSDECRLLLSHMALWPWMIWCRHDTSPSVSDTCTCAASGQRQRGVRAGGQDSPRVKSSEHMFADLP